MTSECPVCYGEKPLVVSPCRSKHAFCKDCLKILVRQHGPQFPCPVCRQTLKIPRGGVNRLPLLQPAKEGGASATPAVDGAMAHHRDDDNVDKDDDGAHPHGRAHEPRGRFMALFVYPPNRQRRDGQADPAPSVASHGDQAATHQSDRRYHRHQPQDLPELPPLQWRPFQGPQDLYQPRVRAREAGPRYSYRTQGKQAPGNPFDHLARANRGRGRSVGRSFARSTVRGGDQGGSGVNNMTEDELLALALQEAEYEPMQTFHADYNGHSGQNGGGPPYYRNPSQERHPGSSVCPYHGGPFKQFLSHQGGAALSDEELALRMQENELRAASQNARQHRHGDDDDDDNLALRMQEEEIKAAMQMEKDRRMAEKLHQYDRGLIDTQVLTNDLKRLGCCDSAVHTAGDATDTCVVEGATGGASADGEGDGNVEDVVGILGGFLNPFGSDEDGDTEGEVVRSVAGFVGGILNAAADDADGGNRGCSSCGCGGGRFGRRGRGGRGDFDDDDGPVGGGCGCEGTVRGGCSNRL